MFLINILFIIAKKWKQTMSVTEKDETKCMCPYNVMLFSCRRNEVLIQYMHIGENFKSC